MKFYIRVNNGVLQEFDDIDTALFRFNLAIRSPVYQSGMHPGDLWELVAKDPYSKIIIKSAIKKA